MTLGAQKMELTEPNHLCLQEPCKVVDINRLSLTNVSGVRVRGIEVCLPFGIRTMKAYVFWQLQAPLGWGHLASGRPALGTFIMSLSKC